jgi:hypothetical protein
MRLLSDHHEKVFLDNMSQYVYKIKYKPMLDVEQIRLEPIDRDTFLHMINSNLKWTAQIKDTDIKYINYDMLDITSLSINKPALLNFFEMVENIKYNIFGSSNLYNKYHTWNDDYGFVIICEILSKITNMNFDVFDFFCRWFDMINSLGVKINNRNINVFNKSVILDDDYKKDYNYKNWLYSKPSKIIDYDRNIQIYLFDRYCKPQKHYTINDLISLYETSITPI